MRLGTFVSDVNSFVLSSFASRLACGISSVDSGSSSKLSDSLPRCFPIFLSFKFFLSFAHCLNGFSYDLVVEKFFQIRVFPALLVEYCFLSGFGLVVCCNFQVR